LFLYFVTISLSFVVAYCAFEISTKKSDSETKEEEKERETRKEERGKETKRRKGRKPEK